MKSKTVLAWSILILKSALMGIVISLALMSFGLKVNVEFIGVAVAVFMALTHSEQNLWGRSTGK